MSKAKYKQGRQIMSVSDFESCENRWYRWNGKTRHRSALESLQYHTLDMTIKGGRLYTAEPIMKVDSGADMREGETETWNGIHGQVVAPKGTFEKIWNEAKEGED